MPPLTHRWFLALDIINRCNDPPPDGRPVEITLVEHGVGLHGHRINRFIGIRFPQGLFGATLIEQGSCHLPDDIAPYQAMFPILRN